MRLYFTHATILKTLREDLKKSCAGFNQLTIVFKFTGWSESRAYNLFTNTENRNQRLAKG